jgi:glutathione S-transferase
VREDEDEDEDLYLLALAGDTPGAHRGQPEGLAPEQIEVSLDAGEQRRPGYARINPQMVIPSLVEEDGTVLCQSMAILEYLDEVHLAPPLLPADPKSRARVGPSR